MIEATPGDATSKRLLPVPDETSAGYWEAAARHVLTLARCSNCGQMTLPPDLTCPHCHTIDPRFTFAPVEGRGRIRTWTVIRRPFLQGFDVPFVLVDVQLDDQPRVRIIGRLLDGPDAPLRLDAPVNVAFEDLTPEISVPAFRLA
jgi:uncharacterized OB-fold protein